MSFCLKRSFLSTCAGVLLLASSSTPVTAMTNEEDGAAASTTIKQARPLSEEETQRLQAFKKRMNAKLAQRNDMVLTRLGCYLNQPDSQQTQTTEDVLPYLTLGEKLLEEKVFNRITERRGSLPPLDQELPVNTSLLPYLTILANLDTLLNMNTPYRSSLKYLSRMSVDQIDACARHTETLCLKETELVYRSQELQSSEEIFKVLASKSPEEIDQLANLFEKHKADIFPNFTTQCLVVGGDEGSDDEGSCSVNIDLVQRICRFPIVKELIRLPLSYLEKNLPTFFSKDMDLRDRSINVAKLVNRTFVKFKVQKKRIMKKEIQKNQALMTNKRPSTT